MKPQLNPPKEYIIAKLKCDITKIYEQHYNVLYKEKDNNRAIYLRAVAVALQEALNRMIDVELKPLSDYGDLMTKEVFVGGINDGMFTPHDGTGYYAFEDSESNIEVLIPMIRCGFFDERFTHVMWYNK